jgi:Domain of Unknown Function (DUF748)
MSEQVPNPSSEKYSTAKLVKSAEVRERKWGRRLRRLVIILLILVLGMRALVHVLLPPVLNKVAKSYGLNAAYDRLELSTLGGDVGLWGVRFTPIGGGEPVLAMSYCRARISTWGLLFGHLYVKRVEAEGASLMVERTADGRLPLIERIIGGPAKNPGAALGASKHSSMSLDSPFRIDVARLQDATARFVDHSVTPATDVSLELDALVDNVGVPDTRTSFEISLHSPQALAALYANGSAYSNNNILDADLSMHMYGLDLIPAKEYLAPFGIVPVSHDLAAEATGKFIARVAGGATTNGQPATPTILSATLNLTGLKLISESREAAAIDRVNIDATSLSPAELNLNQILIDGVHATASRSEHGRLAFAGIELGAGSPNNRQQSASFSLPLIRLKQLLVQNVDLGFVDNAMSKPVTLGLRVPKLSVTNLCSKLDRAKAPTTLSLSGSAPGIAKKIWIEGTAKPERAATVFDLAINVGGIDAKGAEPYLEALKINSRLNDGQFTCKIAGEIVPSAKGELAASIKVSDSVFRDGQAVLFSMPLIDFQNTTFDSNAARVHIGTLSLVGPTMELHRSARGIIEGFGFEYDPRAPGGLLIPHDDSTTTATLPIVIPAIAVQKFSWHGAALRLDDASTKQPINLSIQDVVVDGENLAFNFPAEDTQPGHFRASLKLPGVVEDVSVNGNIAAGPQFVQVDLQSSSEGITGEQLKPVLNALGIEPVLRDGTLQFAASAKITQTDQQWLADFGVNDLNLRDGQTNWLSLREMKIAGASFDGKTLRVNSVELNHPAAKISRDADGSITLAGVKILPGKPMGSAIAIAEARWPDTRIDLSLPIIMGVKTFELHDAELGLSDAEVSPPNNLSTTLDLSATNVLAGADGAPTEFTLLLATPGMIDSLKVEGTAKLAPKNQEVHLTATGSGITTNALNSYLPNNVATHFHNGELKATLAARLEQNPLGGSRGSLILKDATLREDAVAAPVGSIGTLHIGVGRFDLAHHRVDIDEISLDHATLAFSANAYSLNMLGFTIASKVFRQIASSLLRPEVTAAPKASDVRTMIAQAREHAPLITVAKLAIRADRISVAAPGLAKPIALTNFSITNTTKIELLGDDPTQCPPFDLQLRFAVEDLIDSITLDSRLAPFADEPSSNLKLDVTGIHGNKLIAFVPALQNKVDGSDLSDGRLTASMASQFEFTRRGMLGIDLTRDITTTFDAKNIELSEAGVARPLAGLEEIRGDGVRFSPPTGSLTIKSLEVTKPMADVVRDNAGIHFLGMTLKMPTGLPAASDNLKSEPQASPATKPATPGPRAEYSLDEFTLSGADLRFEDRVGTPVTILPINQLDIEVKGLSSRALVEKDRPIRFSLLAGAGKIPLPPRTPTPGVEMENREAFAEASVVGNIALVPAPHGFVKASLSGLELTAIRGLAQQYGITLSGATFDVRADVRMRGTETFDVRLYPTFNDLHVSEIPNGPIQRELKLPSPPDGLITALQDADGSISFPLTIPIDAGHLQWDPIFASATSSVGQVLIAALAAAPLKAANLVPMIGGADASKHTKHITPIVIQFAPGESQLTLAQTEDIRRAIKIMRQHESVTVTIQHTLGQNDLRLAEERSNPLSRDSLSIAMELRQQKAELQEMLVSLGAETRAAIASQDAATIQKTIDSLRATAVQLNETEDALDQALELLRPGAARQADRRTRTGAILLADLRLAAVQDVLLRSNVDDAADRVRKATAVFNPNDSTSTGSVVILFVRQSKK